MRLIRTDRVEPLYNVAATRAWEQQSAAQCPPHQLMALAGAAVARLARALVPHARCIWVACGPGNNGGDGLVAATHLHRWAQQQGGLTRVVVTHSGHSALPADAQWAWQQARAAGVEWATEAPAAFDLAIDAVFGIGYSRVPQGAEAAWMRQLRATPSPVLCVDVPSGLQADTGAMSAWPSEPMALAGARFTLSLLTLKPGLFTAAGRDAAGQVWLDTLQTPPDAALLPTAYLHGRPASATVGGQPHASHKGSYGDVVVLGGQDVSVNGAGMTGAAILAARAALHTGAGRVWVGLLGTQSLRWDPVSPGLMFRSTASLLDSTALRTAAVVCGCGGGESVAAVLPKVLTTSTRLVLDADALNAVAASAPLQALLAQRRERVAFTVLTPHPLEAARLLACSTADVMAQRLQAAQAISDRWGVVCVLKGSGTVVSAPGRLPRINPTGNAGLATAGSGDVLAGMLGSVLAPADLSHEQCDEGVLRAVFEHGRVADDWLAAGSGHSLSASRLADALPSLRA
jgi:hydroxyethylthiazole kinase-like uncharacterized protein yjeF